MARSVLLALLGLTLALPSPGSARTWWVTPDGTGDATTIQAGLDLAVAGDTVAVGPGTYVENVSLKSGVSVIGMLGAEQTVLDAGGPYIGARGSELADCLIEGLTLTGAQASYAWEAGVGLSVDGEVEVRDCIVERCSGGGGISATGTLRVSESVFRHNWAGSCVPEPGDIQFQGTLLEVERCTFELGGSGMLGVGSGDVVFRDNVIRDHPWALFELSRWGGFGQYSIVIEGNLFVDNDDAVFTDWSGNPDDLNSIEIRGNTFARSPVTVEFGPGWIVENNVITGGRHGICGPDAETDSIRCNNVWGNDTNWIGLPDLTGSYGNISASPLYCGGSVRDFSLSQNSPCLPANNSCGVLMGAFGQGCGQIAVEPSTWARIKQAYR